MFTIAENWKPLSGRGPVLPIMVYHCHKSCFRLWVLTFLDPLEDVRKTMSPVLGKMLINTLSRNLAHHFRKLVDSQKLHSMNCDLKESFHDMCQCTQWHKLSRKNSDYQIVCTIWSQFCKTKIIYVHTHIYSHSYTYIWSALPLRENLPRGDS